MPSGSRTGEHLFAPRAPHPDMEPTRGSDGLLAEERARSPFHWAESASKTSSPGPAADERSSATGFGGSICPGDDVDLLCSCRLGRPGPPGRGRQAGNGRRRRWITQKRLGEQVRSRSSDLFSDASAGKKRRQVGHRQVGDRRRPAATRRSSPGRVPRPRSTWNRTPQGWRGSMLRAGGEITEPTRKRVVVAQPVDGGSQPRQGSSGRRQARHAGALEPAERRVKGAESPHWAADPTLRPRSKHRHARTPPSRYKRCSAGSVPPARKIGPSEARTERSIMSRPGLA